MRICYVNIMEEAPSRPFLNLVEKIFPRAVRADTEVSIKCVSPGVRSSAVNSAYVDLLNDAAIVEAVMVAEKEGYDAAVVACFLDPGVRVARSTVNMPVLGMGEPTMLFASNLGDRLAVVTAPGEKLIREMERELVLYGFQDRLIANKPVRPITLGGVEMFTRGMQDPQVVASSVLEVAKTCVQDGADVVIVGCNALAPLCTTCGVAQVEDTGVPLVDCTSVSLKMAEALVDLNRSLGLPYISRNAVYALASQKDIQRGQRWFGREIVAAR